MLFKLVLIGDMGVGKTHLLERYKTGQLPSTQPPTIGVEFASKIVPLRAARPSAANTGNCDGGTVMVRAQLWDTAGQERYRSMVKQQYQRAHGAFMVYDVNKRTTYQSVCEFWL